MRHDLHGAAALVTQRFELLFRQDAGVFARRDVRRLLGAATGSSTAGRACSSAFIAATANDDGASASTSTSTAQLRPVTTVPSGTACGDSADSSRARGTGVGPRASRSIAGYRLRRFARRTCRTGCCRCIILRAGGQAEQTGKGRA